MRAVRRDGLFRLGLMVAAIRRTAQARCRPIEIRRRRPASDVGGPYAAMPPEAAGSRYGPALLPPRRSTPSLRDNGFSPLGAPRQRGRVYTHRGDRSARRGRAGW